MNCKNCQTELEEGVTLCPNCGAENAEPAVAEETVETAQIFTEPSAEAPAEIAEPEKTRLSAGKIALLAGLAVAAVAVIVSLLLSSGSKKPTGTTEPTGTMAPAVTVPVGTIPADGNPDDVTCKGSYTVTDDRIADAASTVVATVGDRQLTNEQLNVNYWIEVFNFLEEYYSYAAMFGLDVNQPLDTQLSLDGSKTWQQFFLESALNNWHWYQSMSLEAQAKGFVMEQTYADYLENLPASLEQSAADAGFASADAMIQADMGVAASVESWVSYWRDYYESYMYYGQEMESVQLTDAEVEAYFDAHASEYAENGLTKNEEYYVDVRHILITPTSAAGGSTYTEEEWSVAENKANEILNQWLSGAADETSFAELAEEYTMDPGSASTGGLYENVYVGQMVPEFESWCFDAARQPGDYGMVKTTYGYHLMYFIRSTPAWYLTAWQDLMSEKDHAFQEAVMEQHPIEIDYSAIALGLVNLGVTG